MTILPKEIPTKETKNKLVGQEEAEALADVSDVPAATPIKTVANEIADQSVISPTQASPDKEDLPKEINGPKGLEPTRYGDWESKGRCHDF